jgi:hypothetical protein
MTDVMPESLEPVGFQNSAPLLTGGDQLSGGRAIAAVSRWCCI